MNGRTKVLLVATGFNLILLQLFVVREMAITLFCTEIIILAITVAYFAGCSIGYCVSPRIGPRAVKPWLFAVVLLHLPLIPAVRALSGWLSGLDQDSLRRAPGCGHHRAVPHELLHDPSYRRRSPGAVTRAAAWRAATASSWAVGLRASPRPRGTR